MGQNTSLSPPPCASIREVPDLGFARAPVHLAGVAGTEVRGVADRERQSLIAGVVLRVGAEHHVVAVVPPTDALSVVLQVLQDGVKDLDLWRRAGIEKRLVPTGEPGQHLPHHGDLLFRPLLVKFGIERDSSETHGTESFEVGKETVDGLRREHQADTQWTLVQRFQLFHHLVIDRPAVR
jgi:hypothetical protein